MTLKRRLARLEELMCPGEVTLEQRVLSACSAEYAEWLQDEVEAGRLRHGTTARLILEAGGHRTAAEIDELLIAMNRTGRDPKPARPAPRVEARISAGYRVDASPESPAVPTVPTATVAPVADPVPADVEPARIVKFMGAPVRDELTYNPMDLEIE